MTLLSKVYVVDNQDKRCNPEHELVRNEVYDFLKENNINFVALKSEELVLNVFDNASLVITIGGDGTLIGASHFIKKSAVILGVQSNSKSVGYLCQVKSLKVKESFLKIIKKEYEIKKFSRLRVVINGGEAFPFHALNEVSFANKSTPRRTVYYKLETESFSEEQAGDILLFSTGTGSTAYIKDLAEWHGSKEYAGEDELTRFGLYACYKGEKRFGDLKGSWAKVTVLTDEGAYFSIDTQKTHFLKPRDYFQVLSGKKLKFLKIKA